MPKIIRGSLILQDGELMGWLLSSLRFHNRVVSQVDMLARMRPFEDIEFNDISIA
jgi:hypothetical protein